MKILNFGSLNLDLVYQMPHFVRAGETLSSTSFSRNVGGKGLNQSVALAKAGAEIYHAGLVGEDGETHHGAWDFATMLPMPNLTVLAPRDVGELRTMLAWTLTRKGPCAIRYGKSSVDLSARYPNQSAFTPGKWEILENGDDCTLLAVGSMVEIAIPVRDKLAEKGVHARLVNCSSVKPMDEALLKEVAGKPVFTLEEHVRTGGFGAAVGGFYAQHAMPAPVKCFALPDEFVTHGERGLLLDKLGLSADKITADILSALERK